MKRVLSTRQLVYLAICIALSLVSKRIVSPLTNLITDFVRLPGGGAATAFSILFLVIGTSGISWPFAGTFAAFIQGILAMCLGMSGYQGAMIILTYTFPGIVIDLVRAVVPARGNLYYMMCCGAANTAAAVIANLLVFHFRSAAFVLWLLIALWFGVFAGFLGVELNRRLIGAVRRRAY